MIPPLRLALRLLDREPSYGTRPDLLSHQVWQGGVTDLSSRRMIAEPPFWLFLADHGSDQQAPPKGDALLSWDLEQIVPGQLRSPETAGGVILVSMDVDQGHEEEFNAWYNTEHIPQLRAVLGVIAARRFRTINPSRAGVPAYVALYHVENTDIYATRTWVVANETPWMLRMRRVQQNRTYFMFRTRIA